MYLSTSLSFITIVPDDGGSARFGNVKGVLFHIDIAASLRRLHCLYRYLFVECLAIVVSKMVEKLLE